MRLVFALGIAVLTVVLLTTIGQAQTVPPPPEGAGDGFGAAGSILAVFLGLFLIVGAAVKFYDLRRKREAEAVHLQGQISDALLRDPGLFGLAVTPTVHVPTWSGSPAVIELAGGVPSAEVKETVLRTVRSEASRLRSDFEIDDRLAVMPAMQRHAA